MLINALAFVGYLLTIPTANWLIGHVGTECVPNGPCLIPVGFGLLAPSGVLVVGVALVLRDLIQNRLGFKWAAAAILFGAIASFSVASPALVFASVAAFLVSEILDMGVYTPLAKRHLTVAVLASGLVGAVADSAVFLWVAFGSLDFIAGQVVGKMWATVAAAAVLVAVHNKWRVA